MGELIQKYKIKLMMPANDWFGLFEWPQWATLQEEPVVAFASMVVCDLTILEEYAFNWEEAEREDMAHRIVVPMFKDYNWDRIGAQIEPYISSTKDDLGILRWLYRGEGNHGFNMAELVNKNFKEKADAKQ